MLNMKTPGAVLLLLWSGLVVVAAESGDLQDEATGADPAYPQQNSLSEVHAGLREMAALMEEQREEFRLAKAQIEKLKKANAACPPRVVFSTSFAVVDDKHIGPFDTDTPLVFDFIFINIGNAYNSKTGVFTAPVKGVYQFSYHIFAGGDNGAGAKLHKNGQHVVSAYHHKAPHDINTSQGVSLLLKVGDKVALILEKGWWVAAYTAHPTTFSGNLLFPK